MSRTELETKAKLNGLTPLKSGARIVVYSEIEPVKKIYGFGTYLGEENGDIAYRASFGELPRDGITAADGRIYFPQDYERATNPKIEMDNGEIIYGYKFWWELLE